MGLVKGDIINPDIINNIKIPISKNVDVNNALIAILCVLKIQILVINIGNMLIRIIMGEVNEILNFLKISLITKAKVWAEKEQAAILAIHKKKPIIKARNPPNPSLLKLYAPPATGRLVESSE